MPPTANAPAVASATSPSTATDPAAMLLAAQARKADPQANDVPKVRPEIPRDVTSRVNHWFSECDNLTQRRNALWEYREASKALFPSRFNANDPRRGQTPAELRSGKDNRRVQVPRIYRDSIQTTAMSVPEDLNFQWNERPQVQPPAVPGQPTATGVNPGAKGFAETLQIVQQNLLEEADWLPKLQAWVQDSSCYPLAVIKVTFRRDYKTSALSATPLSKDATDSMARLEALMGQYASKGFDDSSTQYNEMASLFKMLQAQAEVSRFYGLVISLIPMDAFGMSEDATDLVHVYDTPWMFEDALLTGSEILARYPYKVGEDGETYGVLPEELAKAVPWDTSSTSTDPNSRNRASRNRQLTAPRATSINAVSTTGAGTIEPRDRKFVVREIHSKKDRKVYTLVRGLDHFVECVIPTKTSEQWYPYHVFTPNRVPTEIYGASDLELKRDIQYRIHRKRTDEEKARFLSIDRYVYNTTMVDSKEMLKLQDIPPGQFKGINLGNGQKLTDSIMPLSHAFKPENFDTSKDERDLEAMGALPVQALGVTGQANFATEVSAATQGASVATQHRQNCIRREVDRVLIASAELMLQELTREEVERIAGPFAVWPDIYSEQEGKQIVQEAQQRAMQTVTPVVMQQTIVQMQQGIPLDPRAVQSALESTAAAIWQNELTQKYGQPEPMTRESLFRRLKVRVKSTLLSSMDRQQRIGSFNMLAGAMLQLAQAAQATGQPFNPRPLLKNFALLANDDDSIDEMFPGIPPMQMAAQQIQQASAAAGEMAVPGSPNSQGPQGQHADQGRQPADDRQSQSPGAPTPDQAALG